jgi:hypothetical protein
VADVCPSASGCRRGCRRRSSFRCPPALGDELDVGDVLHGSWTTTSDCPATRWRNRFRGSSGSCASAARGRPRHRSADRTEQRPEMDPDRSSVVRLPKFLSAKIAAPIQRSNRPLPITKKKPQARSPNSTFVSDCWMTSPSSARSVARRPSRV